MSYGYTRYGALFTPNQLKWHQNMEDWPIMFLFLLQWVMLRFPFAVSIPNESCSEQKHVMTMVTVSDAGKRLIKTTQARPDCREFLYVFISNQSGLLHSPKTNIAPKKRPSQKKSSLPTINFHIFYVGFREGKWEHAPQYVSIGVILLKAARFRLEFSYYSVFILVASRKSHGQVTQYRRVAKRNFF